MQFNWPIIGHKAAVQFLQTALANTTLHHAYLLWGPQGVGKTTLANLFVRSLLCQSDSQHGRKPCDVCTSCTMLGKHIHPDVIWVTRGEERVISIDAVRALLDRVSSTSFLYSYKVAIIEEADHLTLEAANALLKILEESPRNTLFILTAPAPSLLPATVVSRLHVLPLRLQPTLVIAEALQRQGMHHDEAHRVAVMSYGRPGRAQHLQQKKCAKAWYEGRARAEEFVGVSAGGRIAKVPDMLKDYGAEDVLMMLNVAGREALLHAAHEPLSYVALQQIIRLLQGLQEVPRLIARNTSVRAAFEYASTQ